MSYEEATLMCHIYASAMSSDQDLKLWAKGTAGKLAALVNRTENGQPWDHTAASRIIKHCLAMKSDHRKHQVN